MMVLLFKIPLLCEEGNITLHNQPPCRTWHTHAVIQFALGIFLVLGTQQDQIEITAAGPQGWDEHIYHAKDNVVVTYRDMRLAADEVTYDDSAKILTADGRLKFSRNEEQLDASHVSFNVETKAGDFSNVSGKMGPGFFITAEQAHRTEEGQYQLKNATVARYRTRPRESRCRRCLRRTGSDREDGARGFWHSVISATTFTEPRIWTWSVRSCSARFTRMDSTSSRLPCSSRWRSPAATGRRRA